jgi:competence protein ComEC
MLWSKLPLLPVALLFAAGVISARFIPDLDRCVVPGFTFLVILWFLAFRYISAYGIYRRIIMHIILLVFIYFSGCFWFVKQCYLLNANRLPVHMAIDVQGVIVSAPVTTNYRKFALLVHSFRTTSGTWNYTDCEIMVHMHPDIPAGSLLVEGNEVLLRGNITDITALENPKAFNYREFLYFKKITQQCILRQGSIAVIRNDGYPSVKSWSRKAREYALSHIRFFTGDEEIRAVTESILLGVNSRIPDDVYADFSTTGTIHILAVSGMHVNIFMFVFLWLSARIKNKSRWISLCKVGLLCTLVWFYVFLTGANPSVLRAGLMFTYLIIGNEAGRKPSILNSLGFSALCLMISDPFHVFNLSFQFSFLAVFGILVMEPVLKALYAPAQKGIQWLWSYLCLSLAAQFFVFPLSVFYFNQFPVYFLIAGIIAVPMGTIILYFGNLLILMGSMASFFKNAFETVVTFFIDSVTYFARLPGSTSGYIHLEVAEMIGWFIMLLILIMFLLKRNINYLILLVVLFMLNYAFRRVVYSQIQEKEEMVFYAISSGYQIDYFRGPQLFSLSSSRLSEKNKSFATSGYRKYKGIAHEIDLSPVRKATGKHFLYDEGHLSLGKRHIWIPDYRKYKHFRCSFDTIDYIFLSTECKKLTYNNLCDKKIHHIILSAGVGPDMACYWKSFAHENWISITDISDHGAYHILMQSLN